MSTNIFLPLRSGITFSTRIPFVRLAYLGFERAPPLRDGLLWAGEGLRVSQTATGLCDSLDLPEGIVVENKVRFNLLISRFKALKPVQPYLCIRSSMYNRAQDHFSEYERCIAKDFQPFDVLEVDILTYGGAGRGLAEG